MGVYECFEKELNTKKAEIISTMQEILTKGVDRNVERFDIIIFPGEYQIMNVIMYSMNKDREILSRDKVNGFCGSVNLAGPIFVNNNETYMTREEENNVKAKMLYSIENMLSDYAKEIKVPMQLMFYKSHQAYDLKNKIWVSVS